MSLNQEAMDDLDQEAEYLTTETDNPESKEDLVVKTDERIDPSLPQDVDVTVSRLEDYNTHIRTVEDGIEKTHDLQDVMDTVLANETIGQAGAVEIEDRVGGLAEAVAPVNEYTQAPSSVNYKETKNYVAQKLQSSYDLVSVKHKAYLEATLEQAKELHTKLLEEEIPSLLRELDGARAETSDEIEDTFDISEYLAYTKGEEPARLVNLATEPMTSTPMHELYQISEDYEHLVPEDDQLKYVKYIDQEEVRQVLAKCYSFSDMDNSIRPDSYMKILELFNMGILSRYLTGIQMDLEENEPKVKQLEQMKETSNNLESLENLVKLTKDYYYHLNNAAKVCRVIRGYVACAMKIVEAYD